MPTIVFSDGTKRKCGYDKGSQILAFLNGKKEPNEKQQEFLLKVETVIFEPVLRVAKKPQTDPEKIERSKQVLKILSSKMSGRDKAKAVADLLK